MGPESTVPFTTPTVQSATISRFPCNFFPELPLIFLFVTIHQVIWPSAGEGTGTWPDYLVNRVLTKNEGPYLKKIVRNSRNSCRKNSGGVGAHGKLTWSSNRVSPETNTNAQRILLKSRLLRSPWYPLALNCWSFPHCFPVPSLEACLQIVTFFQ